MLLPTAKFILPYSYSKMINMIRNPPLLQRTARIDFKNELPNHRSNNPNNLIKKFYTHASSQARIPSNTLKKCDEYTRQINFVSTSVKWFSSRKNIDGLSLNGGYIPSYVMHFINDKPKFVPMSNWRWYAESKEIPGSVRQSGGGIGKLDSANEDGFFFKLNKSRLKKLKQLLKEKSELKSKETPPGKKSE